MTAAHSKRIKQVDNRAKPPLEREALADIVNLALTAGQLLMEHGAESERVEETVRTVGTGLGCDWGNVLVSYNAIIVTHISGNEFRTKIRRLKAPGVNMTMIAAISHLTHLVERGEINRFKMRLELERLIAETVHYNRWIVAPSVGLGCAAFSRLFGGDWLSFVVTLIAATLAMIVRQELVRRKFNMFLTTIATAFVAGGLVGLVNLFLVNSHLEVALAASELLLVPGVPFINTVEDLIKGHIVVGIARGVVSFLIIISIALGLVLAMQLTNIGGL